jgi:xanthine dehydrogenase accessory factor
MTARDLISKIIERHGKAALVVIADAKGSVPRETGAWMLVTADGFHGSIGGGVLEWKAMAEAQKLLQQDEGQKRMDYVLGPDLGQCCGGRVQLNIEILDAKSGLSHLALDDESRHTLLLFGAGHVGRALVLAMALLPFDILWIDPRPHAFPTHVPGNVTLLQPADPLTVLAQAPPASLALVMTHSHELDLAIVDAALRHPNVAHVGLIGSATKRARFEKRLHQAGVDQARIDDLICPIGVAGISSKHPAAIAASVTAQMLQLASALSEQMPHTSQKVAL